MPTGTVLTSALSDAIARPDVIHDRGRVFADLAVAIEAIPTEHRHRLLITIAGAGSSHKVIEHLTTLNARAGFTVEYSVGFDLDARVRNAISLLPEDVWTPALDSKGAAREDASIAEVTGLLREGHRPSEVVVVFVRHQLRLGRRGRHRLRPAVLDPPAAVGRAAGGPEPQTLRYRLLYTGARIIKRATHTDSAGTRNLALGCGTRRRIHAGPRDPLIARSQLTQPKKENTTTGK